MASPQTANPDGATVPCKTHANLLKACERADTDAIARELSEYCDLNVRDHDGQTLLMVTAHRGSVGMVKQLLLHSADPNVCDGGGVDALSLAAAGCHDDVVGILLDFGAMADRPDAQGTTPLMRVAACTSNAALRTVEQLLASRANPLRKNASGETPLEIATRQGGAAPIIELIRRAAAAAAPQQQLLRRRVVLHGLSARPELNGRAGVAVSFDPSTGRYGVQLDGSGGRAEKVALRPANLVGDDADGPNGDAPTPTGGRHASAVTSAESAAATGGGSGAGGAAEAAEPAAAPAVESHLNDTVRTRHDARHDARHAAATAAPAEATGPAAAAAAAEAAATAAAAAAAAAAAPARPRRSSSSPGRRSSSPGSPVPTAEAAPVDLAAVDSWLKRGANVDVPIDEGGGTMLMSAAYQGHRALVDLLLEHRADVHAQKPADGCTALLCAVQGAAMSELRALDSALGARHSPTDAAPADECSGSSSSSGGGGSSSSSGGGGSSSSSSSGGGSSSSSGGGGGGVSMDMYIIKRLLDEDADPNQLCRKGAAYAISPLLFATQLGATGVVELLLSRRALPDLDNELVPKPLVVACASRHVAIARLLLQHHAQVELVNSTECLPECMLIASLIRWSSSIRLSASLSASLMTSLSAC
jgi:hypothetical protein